MCLTEWVSLLRKSPKAPVRTGGLLSKSAIAQVALILLCDGKPGVYLELLLLMLLDLDRPKINASKQADARYEAAWIVAQSGLGPRAIARRVGVAASTVTRWLKDPAFNKEVDENRKRKALLVKKGKWPPKKRFDRAKID
jgi:hypothetical protein